MVLKTIIYVVKQKSHQLKSTQLIRITTLLTTQTNAMKRTLRTEILIAIIAVFSSFIALVTFFAISKVKTTSESRIKDFKETRMLDAKQKLSGLVQTASGVLQYYHQQVESGEIELSQAKIKAAEQIRAIRYDSTGYFWVDNTNYQLIVLPPAPEKEGMNRENLMDVNGKRMVKELVDVAVRDGFAYVNYHFRKISSKTPSPKLGHSQLFEPWGWVIGTGFYIDEIETQITEQEKTQREVTASLVQQIVTGAVIGLLFVLAIIWFIISYSMKAVVDLREVVDAGTKGDLTKRVLRSRKNDIGILLRSFNQFIGKLEGIMLQVKDGAETMKNTAKNIHIANDSLAEKSSIQASAVEETSTTLEQVQATIENNNKHTVSTEELSALTAENTKIATKHSKKLSLSMTAITESSQEITEMLELIQEIAFQTHILSLNAGIEASKAGEHGKGFGVVANEIRNLAARTTSAGKKIGKLIKHNNKILEQGSSEVNDTMNRLIDISQKVASINNKVGEVSLSAKEQLRAVTQINKAIQEIDTAIQANALVAEQTSAEASGLMETAIEFYDLIGFFQLSPAEIRGKQIQL